MAARAGARFLHLRGTQLDRMNLPQVFQFKEQMQSSEIIHYIQGRCEPKSCI